MSRPHDIAALAPHPDVDAWHTWMGDAMELARTECAAAQDVPVAALVLAPDGSVLGRGWNQREATGDPTAHAEVLAIRDAVRNASLRGGLTDDVTAGHRDALRPRALRDDWRLPGCTLVVTLEPCVMCAGAIVAARVPLVVWGAWDPKAGACGSVWSLADDPRANHRATLVGGVREPECAALLKDFFRRRRHGRV